MFTSAFSLSENKTDLKNYLTIAPLNKEQAPIVPEKEPLDAMFESIMKLTGIGLSLAEKTILEKEIKCKRLRRHHYFLQEGDVSKNIGFIVKGSMRMFSINEKGMDSIIELGIDHDWILEPDSYFNRKPSDYHIEAVENTDLLVISQNQLEKLVSAIPALHYLLNVISHCKLITARKRMNALISMTAKDRYDTLLASHPAYIQKFSQSMIASYLGIQPETLSRIRKIV